MQHDEINWSILYFRRHTVPAVIYPGKVHIFLRRSEKVCGANIHHSNCREIGPRFLHKPFQNRLFHFRAPASVFLAFEVFRARYVPFFGRCKSRSVVLYNGCDRLHRQGIFRCPGISHLFLMTDAEIAFSGCNQIGASSL